MTLLRFPSSKCPYCSLILRIGRYHDCRIGHTWLIDGLQECKPIRDEKSGPAGGSSAARGALSTAKRPRKTATRASRRVAAPHEALRRARLKLMTDDEKPYYAHPMFWAPFVVVGEGGEPRG